MGRHKFTEEERRHLESNPNIVAYNASSHLGLSTAYMGLIERLEKLSAKTRHRLMIHSDQGVHYANAVYINKLAKYGVKQSMSRRGNCLDNAPIESFFGHLKDEMDLNSCKSIEEVRDAVCKYVHYYNNERMQWNLNKMIPVEYRSHLLKDHLIKL